MAKKKPAPTEPILRHVAVIPRELARLRVTLKKLESKSVQKQILKHYGPQAMNTVMQSYMQAASEGNIAACRDLAEMYNLKEPKNGVSIVTNLDNRHVTVEEGPDRTITRSFAGIARGFSAERERRKLTAGPASAATLEATFVATPTGPRED